MSLASLEPFALVCQMKANSVGISGPLTSNADYQTLNENIRTAVKFIGCVWTVGLIIADSSYGNAISIIAFVVTDRTVEGAAEFGIFVGFIRTIRFSVADVNLVHTFAVSSAQKLVR